MDQFGDESDLYVDYPLIAGADFVLRYTLAPLDWTGAIGLLKIDTLAPAGLAATLTVTGGVIKTSEFKRVIAAATTAGYAKGVYPYGVWITYPGGTVRRHGHGRIIVQ